MNNTTDDSLKLENQLCFPLYACSKEIIKMYKPFLDKLDLTYTQYITMIVLWEKKSQSVKELGEVLYLDSGTLTPVLKKLESKGYLTRQRSLTDERSLVVTITEKGEALKANARDITRNVGKCIPLSKEEEAKLYYLLYKILNSIE
ncbi:MAG: MarR family winged helix-turn-helix transcriptional regulator [Lachnospiraceae bacterium]